MGSLQMYRLLALEAKHRRVLQVLSSSVSQKYTLISSSETADGVSTPDSVMSADIRCGGCKY